MPQSHQLAAIMFTDIVGYTALMGRDEQKAFELLNKNRQIQKPIIEQYNGRWIKELGDGVLASFNAASDAVNAAIKIQEACNAANDFQLRIGIHQGEVVFENNDVFGDGVNIASRLQAIAVPGAIYVSEAVHHNVSNKKDIQTKFIREEVLKNVKEPVKIYEVITAGISSQQPETSISQTKDLSKVKPERKSSRWLILFALVSIIAISLAGYFLLPLFNKKKNITSNKWVAILPFRLISSDSSIEWLSDGFTEELTSSIAGISNLKVKSPTTMMQYKNSKKSAKEIGEELDVASIIDGSLQKEGNNIIINARLINPLTEEILKNFKFRKDASEIKSIYSEVAQQVADILNVTLTSEERKRLQKVIKVDPELYSLYLQGFSYAKKFTPQDEIEAIKIFDRAIKKDSNYAPALAGKAFAIGGMATWFATISRADAIQQTDPLYSKSIALDSNLSLVYSSMGWAEMCFKWDFKNAEKDLLKSFSIDPSDDVALSGLVFVYMYGGNYKEANKCWETGKAISPNSSWVDVGHGMTLYLLGKIPEAIQFNKDGIEKYDHILFYDKLGWVYNLTGKYKEVQTVRVEIKI